MNINNFKKFLVNEVESNELNRLPDDFDNGKIFSAPIIGVAKGNDPIFIKFKEVIGPEHLTPAEMWISNGLINEIELSSKLRIISIVFPYVKRIRDLSISQTELPADIYSIGRNYANEFIADILKKSVQYFKNAGFDAMVPILSNSYNHIVSPFYSNWSDRHIAFAAGLGTFSLHEGFITDLGCNVRFGSFITIAPLEITPRKSDEPYGNCLFYSNGTCKKCIERCPGNAISESGHDKVACFIYGQKIARKMNKKLKKYLKPTLRHINGVWEKHRPAVGCAFCQFGVPCMDKNPMQKKKN
ncbi:MAG: hypothetical protein ACTSPY_16630 [Candidatus Helarchaeota archaeon]